MRSNVYHNSTRELSRMFPQGLDSRHSGRTIAPLLLSGEYDSTIRLFTTVDGTLPSNGDVEAPTGWFAIFEMPDTLGERESTETWLRGCDETQDEIRLPDGGWYLYTQDNNGISMVYECEDGDHADLLYSMLSERYGEYEVGDLDEREKEYLRLSTELVARVSEERYDDETREIMQALIELAASDEEVERVRTWKRIHRQPKH